MRATARVGTVAILTAVLAVATCLVAAMPAGAVQTSRGFNGKTITVGGMGYTANFSGADIGAEAYFSAINKTNYLKGVKIKFTTFLNDNQDPATGLTDVRQLVTQDQVFAIVPDLSDVNPGSYLAAQQVPYVGYAFDYTYCSNSPSTHIWGFGYNGCLVPNSPSKMPNSLQALYNYVKAKTGKAQPTIALFSSNTESGANSARLQSVSANGAGFKVVYNKAPVPVTATDYTPYVQQLMTSAGGKQPNAIVCLLATQCIPVWTALKNAGYTGTYDSTLGPVAALATSLAGTVTSAFYNTAPSAGLAAMTKAISTFSPGTALTGYANVPAYFAAAMFVQAVHTVQAKRQAITPANVQKALSTITWSIPGLVGPIKYPASTEIPTPYCYEFVSYTGGTTQAVDPYTCSYKTFKVTAKNSASVG